MKHTNASENYLEKIPAHSDTITWQADERGIVTIAKPNKGVFNRIAQKLFKKPPVSYIHLDEFGSFVWQIVDGKRDILSLGKEVDAHFGEKASPLYERLAKYFRILESYGFIRY